jgi:hypothetical protein
MTNHHALVSSSGNQRHFAGQRAKPGNKMSMGVKRRFKVYTVLWFKGAGFFALKLDFVLNEGKIGKRVLNRSASMPLLYIQVKVVPGKRYTLQVDAIPNATGGKRAFSAKSRRWLGKR